MRFVVTGAAGFIGSNLIAGLNARGIDDIIAVDDLRQGDKFRNLADLRIAHYEDATDFYAAFAKGRYGQVEAVFHQGACSDTMEQDGRYMMRNNYGVSCEVLAACQAQGTRMLYASSAAVYGGSSKFTESPECELPLNVYGYSKLLFDQCLRNRFGAGLATAQTQIVGFRYFNVYGPREQHKGRMASVAFHQFHQYRQDGQVKLFGEYGGYSAGEQLRDFIHVDDVVAVNLWFLDHPDKRGIFNLGTGRAQTFNEVARAVVGEMAKAEPVDITQPDVVDLPLERQDIAYVPFPEALKGKYQCYTQADLSALRAAGCDHAFEDVASGVGRYIQALKLAA